MTVPEIKEAIRKLTPEEQREVSQLVDKLLGAEHALSKSALGKDWNRPEEDIAWTEFQKERK
jgi:hypothetical protein